MPAPGEASSRFGGVAFVVAGALFLTYDLLEFIAGPPPPTGEGILSWVAANRLALSLVSEVLFFAGVCLIPAVAALYRSLADRPEKGLVVTGCGILWILVPLLSMLLVVHGRLVYPIFGLRIRDPAVAELAVALFFGGLHAVDLLLSGATFALSLVMRRSAFGGRIAALGFATTAANVAASYPHLIGPFALLGCRFLFVGWLASVGVRLLGSLNVATARAG